MKLIKFICIFKIAVISMVASGCGETEYPWLDEKIQSFKSLPVGNPPREVWQYEYNGEVVFFFPAQCCDQMSELYNDEGKLICSPDGGITGRGDGRCNDFHKTRSAKQLIWKDERGKG